MATSFDMGAPQLEDPQTPSSVTFERSRLVELHQRLAPVLKRAAARHRRRLDRLQQLALGRAVLDRAAHVRDHAFFTPR